MPLELDDVLANSTDADQAWMVIEPVSGVRLKVPQDEYPGTEVVRLFISADDANTFIKKIRAVPTNIKPTTLLVAVPVPLLATMRAVAAEREAGSKVGFAVYGPNEVLDFNFDRGLGWQP